MNIYFDCENLLDRYHSITKLIPSFSDERFEEYKQNLIKARESMEKEQQGGEKLEHIIIDSFPSQNKTKFGGK